VLRERFAAAFKARTRDEWTEIFLPGDACVAPVLSLKEAAEHPYNTERDVFVEKDGHLQPAPAPRLSRTPGAIAGPPTLPGVHTREVLEEFGFTDVDELLAEGAVAQGG
jgi:alpha-methylacyl-CoA racemase